MKLLDNIVQILDISLKRFVAALPDFYNIKTIALQLGIGTYSFPWAFGIKNHMPGKPMIAADLVHYASRKKLNVVQFGDNYPLHRLRAAEQAALRKLAEDHDIGIEVGARGLTYRMAEQYIALSKFFGSPFLRMVIDDENYHPGVPEIKQELHNIIPLLKQNGIKLAIENHDRFAANLLVEIIESTDPEWIGICLDTANSIGVGEGITHILSILAPYTINLHIKDFTISRVPHKMGFTVSGCAAGTGMLDVPAMLQELKKYKRCHTAVLEVWSNPLDTVEETIRQEKAWVDQSIIYLKSIVS